MSSFNKQKTKETKEYSINFNAATAKVNRDSFRGRHPQASKSIMEIPPLVYF